MDQKGRGGGDGGGVSHRHGVHPLETAGEERAGRQDKRVGAPFGRGSPERCERASGQRGGCAYGRRCGSWKGHARN